MLGLILWIYGGAQSGFYKTYYVVSQIDEITEIEFPVKVEAFLPGIETLVAGFALFVALLTLSSILESSSEDS